MNDPAQFIDRVHDTLHARDLDAESPTGTWVDWTSADTVRATVPDVLPFATSGTTGTPITWWWRRKQLEAEAEVLAANLGNTDIDGVICHAAPRHLFGYLGAVMLPRLLGVPVLIGSPLDAASCYRQLHRPLIITVPSTWAAWTRSRHRVTDGAQVLHGTGPVPDPRAVAAVDRELLSDRRYTEVLGSTETGAIAFRNRPAGNWRLAADVTVERPDAGGIGRLHIRSPRLAGPDPDAESSITRRHTDVVRRVDRDHVELLGRSSAVVKVNGRRVDLDGVLTRLQPLTPEIHPVRVPDRVRGEWYDLIVSDSIGRVVGPGDISTDRVIQLCTERLRPWERPRRVVTAAKEDAR